MVLLKCSRCSPLVTVPERQIKPFFSPSLASLLRVRCARMINPPPLIQHLCKVGCGLAHSPQKTAPWHPSQISVHLRCEKNGPRPCQPPDSSACTAGICGRSRAPVWVECKYRLRYVFVSVLFYAESLGTEQADVRKAIRLVEMDCGVCRLSRPDVELLLCR